jgi:hypothetical protein
VRRARNSALDVAERFVRSATRSFQMLRAWYDVLSAGTECRPPRSERSRTEVVERGAQNSVLRTGATAPSSAYRVLSTER